MIRRLFERIVFWFGCQQVKPETHYESSYPETDSEWFCPEFAIRELLHCANAEVSEMNAAQTVDKFCTDTLNGKRPAGQLQIAAVRRYRKDIKEQHRHGWYFDQRRAELSVAFLPLLCHTKGEFDGKPFIPSPWQVFIIWNLFGWRRADGTRRFRRAHIEIARKNGKSTLAAAIMLLCFVLDGEPCSEIYCAATKRDQAAIVWDEACRMVARRPYLSSRIKPLESKKQLLLPDGSKFLPLAADGKTADGLNPHCVCFDELHAWQARHEEFHAKLTTGSGSRRQPLFFTITTAGDDRAALWIRERDYCSKVVTGDAIDDSLFVFICCIDDADNPLDPEVWEKANPNLGVSVKLEYLEELAAKAAIVAAALNEFRRYHCNQKVESLQRAITDQLWAVGAEPLPNLGGRNLYLGIDLGWRNDIAAISGTFPPLVGSGKYYWKSWGWIPEKTERDLTAEPWATWIQNKSLTVTKGNTTDTASMMKLIMQLKQIYNLKTIALDGNNAREFGTQLMARGFKVYEFDQTCRSYNEPMRKMLELLEAGQLIHGDDPLLSFAASNLITFTNSEGLTRPSKQSSPEKIDPIVAGIMSLSEALFAAARDKDTGDGPRIRIV
ncbi:MAG: terminase large subunit [Planctomycetaceae bacterium]|nr:terminase large subunit [Planctomycetaceae bacterium]